MAAYVQDNTFLTRRAMVFVAVVIIHILAIYAFASGLARRAIEVIAPPLQTNIIQETQKRDQPPPPPPPKMERPPVEVPAPVVDINVPVEATTTAITNVTTKPHKAAPPPPPAPMVRVQPRLDTRHSPSTDDYYPPTSRRMGETGTTTVNVCVAPDGRVAGQPKVQRSSGSSRLDEAALKWAARARFAPGTENGRPKELCLGLNVKFVLTD